MTSTAAIEVRGLRKSYKQTEVLRGVDLTVATGEVFALLGPNGAGKTTTVEILEGFRTRTDGSVSVLGVDPAQPTPQWRSEVGVVPQRTGAFDELTVGELVGHFATFYPRPLPAAEAIELVGLTDKTTTRAGRLSGGQQRRLDIALGVVGDPRLVFLDEPTTGLDPAARRQTWSLISGMAERGHTIVLTTHYLDEVEALANRAAVLIRGEIVAIGPPSELGGRGSGDAVVTFHRAGPLAGRPLPVGLPATGGDAEGCGEVRLTTSEPTGVLASLTSWAAGLGSAELPGLTVTRPTLEDVYLRMLVQNENTTQTMIAPQAPLGTEEAA